MCSCSWARALVGLLFMIQLLLPELRDTLALLGLWWLYKHLEEYWA